jgi:hypothetical protein
MKNSFIKEINKTELFGGRFTSIEYFINDSDFIIQYYLSIDNINFFRSIKGKYFGINLRGYINI